ncbi:MAG: ligase-associated DNA damage response exonuclease [Phycisphaerales bacterium JB040]
MAERALIESTPDGLWCAEGGFHIDPWRPVERAVITHAHADHARSGCGAYWCTPGTAGLLRKRIGPGITARELGYGETIAQDGVRLSLHPAGHVLGSAQARVESMATGEVWVVSGDYKNGATGPVEDPTCAPFEVVACDTFITETTFGLPIYRWPEPGEVAYEINAWWRENADAGRTSVLMTYSLGKAQRVLAMLDAGIGPIGVHGAVAPLNGVYREQGVELPSCVHANKESARDLKGGGMIVAPPSVNGTVWVRGFLGPGGIRTAFASGWMAVRGRRRWGGYDRGFVLSDHADWAGLLATIGATGASRVGTTHGSAGALARYLREERGLEAFSLDTRYTGEGGEDGPGAGEAEHATSSGGQGELL